MSPGTASRSLPMHTPITQHDEQIEGEKTMRDDPWTAANRDKEQQRRSRYRQDASKQLRHRQLQPAQQSRDRSGPVKNLHGSWFRRAGSAAGRPDRGLSGRGRISENPFYAITRRPGLAWARAAALGAEILLSGDGASPISHRRHSSGGSSLRRGFRYDAEKPVTDLSRGGRILRG